MTLTNEQRERLTLAFAEKLLLWDKLQFRELGPSEPVPVVPGLNYIRQEAESRLTRDGPFSSKCDELVKLVESFE